MNWGAVNGHWTLVKANTKQQSGRLNAGSLSQFSGKLSPSTGRTLKTDGDAKQLTEEELKEFVGPHKDHGSRV